MSANREPVKFSDARDATLFCFTPEAREPLAVAVRLPMDGVGNRPTVNGQPTDALDPFNFEDPFTGLQQYEGNMAFWLRTPEGLVFGGPNYGGHWFISDTVLEEAFAAQRKTRSATAAMPPTP